MRIKGVPYKRAREFTSKTALANYLKALATPRYVQRTGYGTWIVWVPEEIQ